MSRNPLDITFGYAQGYKTLQAFGISTNISAVADHIVGPGMETVTALADNEANHFHLLEEPGTLTLTRTSGSDTGKVAVNYIDSDWYERVTVFEMDAASKAVDVLGQTITARRVLLMDYLPGGNVGTLDAKISDQLVCRIGLGHGLSRVAAYCTTKGQRTALTGMGVAAQASKPIEIGLWFKLPGQQPKLLNWWPARETLEVYALPIPRLIQAANLAGFPNVTPITEGIDIFATARRPIGLADTADVSVYLGWIAQVNATDPDAPGFSVF